MPQITHLIVGLGNPGDEYDKTRHNVGFMALDHWADAFGAPAWAKKYKALIAPVVIDGVSCLMLKPQTYMNLSGESVGEASRFYKIPSENIVIIHDDLDLVLGQIKAKLGGGSAGHNGLKSIDAHVGNDTWRVRVGIGHPDDRTQVVGYVLGRMTKAERAEIDPLIQRMGEHLSLLLSGEISRFIEKVKQG